MNMKQWVNVKRVFLSIYLSLILRMVRSKMTPYSKTATTICLYDVPRSTAEGHRIAFLQSNLFWQVRKLRPVQKSALGHSHPGSGSDRTIASVRQVMALVMLYIGRLVICGIDYSFTPQSNFFFLHKITQKTQHMRINGKNMTHVRAWHRSVTCCRSLTDCT